MKSYSLAVLSVVSLISTHIATAFEVRYPTTRFTVYDDLPQDKKAAAMGLNFDADTWNQPGSTDIEWSPWWTHVDYDYYDLDGDGDYCDKNNVFEDHAKKLGFYGKDAEDVWDCWMTHFNYDWDDIVDYNLKDSAEALGWDQDLWESENPKRTPASSLKTHSQLTLKEQNAALDFCYTKSLWDADELSTFGTDSTRSVKIGKKPRKCDYAAKDVSRCKVSNNALGINCCNTCGTCAEFKCVNVKGKFLFQIRKRDKKKIYKKCGFIKDQNKRKVCNKKGMKQTCPASCDDDC